MQTIDKLFALIRAEHTREHLGFMADCRRQLCKDALYELPGWG